MGKEIGLSAGIATIPVTSRPRAQKMRVGRRRCWQRRQIAEVPFDFVRRAFASLRMTISKLSTHKITGVWR